ncbi:MAG: TIGR03936 family radical SAM-associated protein [Oscillospiraceae bacterium]|nr:TIGR03936 family radical SAM-associated protein [Oscillospiraceae bacterium]
MNFTNIRVFFSKTGNAKYISHLDLYRAMGRAIKRSALPVWITEGFNPHIYMTFALPLALGIESSGESVDLRLTHEIGFNEISERLNAVMPNGLDVIRTAAPILKADEIKKAEYEIESQPRTLKVIDEYLSRPKIKITKKTKKNIQVIDVKPLLEWESGKVILPAGNALNINPWNVFSGLDESETGDFKVKRTAILCENGRIFA